MSFASEAQDDLDGILSGEFAERIQYESSPPSGAQPWREIQAVVSRGDPRSPLDLGAVRKGPEPCEVIISRRAATGFEQVYPKKDRVRLDPGSSAEMIFRVEAVLEWDDPAAWRLYAVP